MVVGCNDVFNDGYVRARSLGKREENWISKEDVRVRRVSARQLAINLRLTSETWRPGVIKPRKGVDHSNR